MTYVRAAERKVNGEWKPVKMSDIQRGDMFRFLTPAEKQLHKRVWLAVDQPFLNEDKVWSVEATEVATLTLIQEENNGSNL